MAPPSPPERPRRTTSQIPVQNTGDGPAGVDPRLAEALRRAEKQPAEEKFWDELEEIAGELQRPEEVAALFVTILRGGAAADLAGTVGKRAVRFTEEWFGDEKARLLALLEQVLALDPAQDWAFEKLTLLLSVAQSWNELLALYDRTLANLKDGPRRRKLLQEAAGVAKDFLGTMDRAIGYLDELFRGKPGDPHVFASLERLLEKEQKWTDLARVWKTRLEFVGGDEAHELRGRLALLRLNELDDADGAVAEARVLLREKGDDGVACQVLEKVLSLAQAAAETRREALELLRAQHEKQGRKDRIVSVLQTANEFATGGEKVGLLREAAERLQSQGDTAAAMEKLIELLGLAPDDAAVRTRLRHLAELSGAHEAYVRGLSSAAVATKNGQLRGALLIEAGRVEEDVLADHAQAIVLFGRAANDEEADQARRLTALRRLASLLDRDDTAAERLGVLERLAALAPETAEKRTVLGQAGRLAGRTGEVDRAVAAWQARLALDDGDREALDALCSLLADAGRHAPLCEALRKRAEVDKREAEKRADLVRIARLQAQELNDRAAAIETWVEIQGRFGEDNESTQALRDLFGAEARWQDLAGLLSRTGERDRARLAELFCRLGDISRKQLTRPTQAVKAYGFALETDATFAAARAGLQALLDDDSCRRPAIEALVHSYLVAGELAPLAELTDRRLELAADDPARARLLIELGELTLRAGGDRKQALSYFSRALALSPENARIETEILRLAETDAAWTEAANALRGAIPQLPRSSPRVVHLHLQEAAILEEKLRDLPAALSAFDAAHRLAPDRVAAKAGCVRIAATLGQWDTAAVVLLSAPIAAEVVTGELLPLYEQAARQATATAGNGEGLAAAATALSATMGKRKGVPRTLARDLENTIAAWFEAAGGSEGPAQAEAALLRAAKYDRDHVATLTRLADLQRKRPGRPLYDTLTRLFELDPLNLGLGLEALTVAHAVLAERQLALKTGFSVLERAAHLLRSDPRADAAPAPGAIPPATALERALDALVTLLLASGERADAVRAVSALTDAVSLPLPIETVRGLRRRAAKIALDTLADRARARELLRMIVDESPEDAAGTRDAIRTLASLYEEADLLSEALSLRKRELSLGLSVGERLSLRLEMARIAGLIEDRSPRVTTLLANLEEVPGDLATVDALAQILIARNKEADLCDVLTEQAGRLERQAAGAANEHAAALWMRVATLAERNLKDSGRAVTAYERVANLAPTAEAFDALARLSIERGEPLAAAGWLEQRLQGALGDVRVEIALRLGRANLDSGQRHRAIGCLERALAEAPKAHALRALLVETYRKSEAWEPLARALAEGCAHGPDPDTISAYAKEAATLYQEKLHRPDLAVPVLEHAVQLLPKDRWLRTNLAEGLRVAGRLPEARALLEGLLEEMGRRRSKERAAIHHQLALVARAAKDFPAAIENLEHAAAIDVGNLDVLVDLAETATEAGDLEKAERSYQGILVLARRAEPDEARLSASETLLRLQKVAETRGEQSTATEFFDSATAAALQNPAEARRMQNALLARGDTDLALDLCEKRRAAATAAFDEAGILCERAEMLEKLDRTEDAMAAAAAGIERAPDHERAHVTARRIATGAQAPQRYLSIVTNVLDQMRRRDDGPRVCDLLLRAGGAAENDLGDLKQAASFYSRAEQTGARVLDVLESIARTAARQGDKAEETRAIKQLSRMAAEAEPGEARHEISFRVAALQLGSAESRVMGLETLAEVLEKKPDFQRALAIVRAAQVPEDELPRVMPLYEKVARSSGDDAMLLDYLERRSAAADAPQEEVSEGVELALALGLSDRAARLLERAVALAQARGAIREAAWALLDLAQRCKAAGDYENAFKWLEEASQASDSPRIPALLRELAREAARQPAGARLAARALENLRRRNPSEREIWLPLMESYASLADGEKLGALVADTVDKLVDRADRTVLRLTWARFLLGPGATLAEKPARAEKGGKPGKRGKAAEAAGESAPARSPQDEAVTVLRDVLLDEPGHPEALSRLADLHESRGDVAEALALLSDSLREAEARGDEAWRAATARRLGELLKKADPAQAKQVYRQTLSSNIADPALRRELQSSLLELLGEDDLDEKAALAEQMLGDETGEAAAERALALADVRRELGDDAGERRALNVGRARAPGNRALFDRLSELLEDRGDFSGWAQAMDEEAARLASGDPRRAAELLRNAAQTRRHKLQDPAGAAGLLNKAAELDPPDVDQIRELCSCLQELNDMPGAIAAVSAAYNRFGEDAADPSTLTARQIEDRMDLLRLRADLHGKTGDEWAAVADLEQAVALVGAQAMDELIDGLYAASQRSGRDEDLGGQRRAMLRLSSLFAERGEGERAQKLLFDWVDLHPEDMAALGALRERFEAEKNWDRVLEICERMVGAEQGEGKIQAALALSHAYEQLGRANDAVPTLEALLASFPGQPAILNILSGLYAASGDHRKVAVMKIAQADLMTSDEDKFNALVDGADTLLQCGEPEAAIEAINRAFALHPDDRVVQRLLADALLANGQFDQAANVIDSLIGDGRGIESGELCALYHRLSRAAGGMGDVTEQLQALRKGMEADRKNGYVASELADLAETNGDDDLALKALRAITLHATEGPMTKAIAFFRQARIASKTGDRQRVVIFAKRALQEDPNLTDAKALLDSVR